jgi:hypothetical protein
LQRAQEPSRLRDSYRPEDPRGPGIVWGPGNPWGFGNPWEPREFRNPKDLWKREGKRNNEGLGTFENPWRPNKPIFF